MEIRRSLEILGKTLLPASGRRGVSQDFGVVPDLDFSPPYSPSNSSVISDGYDASHESEVDSAFEELEEVIPELKKTRGRMKPKSSSTIKEEPEGSVSEWPVSELDLGTIDMSVHGYNSDTPYLPLMEQIGRRCHDYNSNEFVFNGENLLSAGDQSGSATPQLDLSCTNFNPHNGSNLHELNNNISTVFANSQGTFKPSQTQNLNTAMSAQASAVSILGQDMDVQDLNGAASEPQLPGFYMTGGSIPSDELWKRTLDVLGTISQRRTPKSPSKEQSSQKLRQSAGRMHPYKVKKEEQSTPTDDGSANIGSFDLLTDDNLAKHFFLLQEFMSENCKVPSLLGEGREVNKIPLNRSSSESEKAAKECGGKVGHSESVKPTNRTMCGCRKPRLYNFLLELLEEPEKYKCIEWVNSQNGTFKFLDSGEVARLWGQRKNKPNMKYENFARSLRTYVAKKILVKPRNKLVYQFAKPPSPATED